MVRKTNINNLSIIWQGQSWSVIDPAGEVLRRYKDKQAAINFAQNTKDYIKKETTDYIEPQSSYSYQTSSRRLSKFDAKFLQDTESNKNYFDKRKKVLHRNIWQRLREHWYVRIPLIIAGVVLAAIIVITAMVFVPVILRSVSQVFYAPGTVPILLLFSILVPFLLWLASHMLPGFARLFLSLLLLPIGLGGLISGVVLSIAYFAVSLGTREYNFISIFVTFLLWLWISFCSVHWGGRWYHE